MGRHRAEGLFGLGWPRTPVAIGAGVVVVLLGVLTLRIVSASASGCSGGVQLRIAATPEIAATLEDVANQWMSTRPQVAGECVNVTVTGTPSAIVASRLTVIAGKGIDTGAAPEPTPRQADLPAVWVPDSTAWMVRVQAIDAAAFNDRTASIASSPIVLAMPEAAARAVGWPGVPLSTGVFKSRLATGQIKLGISEPRRETAGLAASMVLSDTIATSDDELPALINTLRGAVKTTSTGELLRTFSDRMNAGTASEQAVLEFDAGNPPAKLAPVMLDPIAPVLDYPYAVRGAQPQPVTQAAAMFLEVLRAPPAAGKLAAKGFRTPDGTLGPGFPSSAAKSQDPQTIAPITDPGRIRRALDLWSAANASTRTLLLLDTTSSMGNFGPNGVQSRGQVMVDAVRQSLDLLGPDSQVGLWTFAGNHQPVLPIDELSGDRRSDLDSRLGNVFPGGSNQSGLYAALLAAYQTMKDGYDPRRPNLIVVLTDAGDSDTSALALAQFDRTVQLQADPTRPIRVVLVGVGADQAGVANLQAIAQTVGGGFSPLTKADQIQSILLKAFLGLSG